MNHVQRIYTHGYDLSTGGINNVYNMYDGYVIYVNETGAGSGYGPNIIIQSTDGMTWLYGDLSPFSGFNVGDFVQQGQYIATEGNPAGTSSTGYHVHIELEYLTFGQSFLYGYENSADPRYTIRLAKSRTVVLIYLMVHQYHQHRQHQQ